MKKITVLTMSLLCSISFADNIVGSNYEPRHQDAIIEAITKQCGSGDEYIQLSTTQRTESPDQGINDEYFTTQIQKRYYVESLKVEETLVTVESVLFDSYDHAHQTWGSYLVKNVNCQ